MSKITTYNDDAVARFFVRVQKSALKNNLTIHWAIQNRVGQISGRPYRQRTVVAVQDGQPVARVRLNRKGSVYWDQIQESSRDTYEVGEQIECHI